MIGREIRALVGLVFEVAQVLFSRRWGNDEHEPRAAPTVDETKTAPAPVVRVTPAASEMVARAAPMRPAPLTEQEPLEGSIEARRAGCEIR